MTPSHFFVFLKGEFLRISSGLEVIIGFFASPSSVCLNYLEMISPSLVCLDSSGIVRTLFSCKLSWLKFTVLVIFVFIIGSKLPFLFLFLFYFLLDPLPFCLSWNPFHLFSSFVWYIPICWHLKILARALMLYFFSFCLSYLY